MSRLVCLLACLLVAPVQAGDAPPPVEETPAPTDPAKAPEKKVPAEKAPAKNGEENGSSEVETFSKKGGGALDPNLQQVTEEPPPEEVAEGDYPSVVKRGAEQMKMDPAFVQGIREGLEKLYLRDYKGTREFFTELEAKYPNTGVAAVADVLVWQALMLENFDFRYEKQYWASTKRARNDLQVALDHEGNEAWESFMLAGISGIESIHTMRKEQYLKALQLAFEAIDHVEKTRKLAPEFTDLLLADGMYNYWRTIITRSSNLLPDFGDKRAEGIQQIQEVERNGIFLSAPSTLSMVFTWHEENRLKNALAACLKNKKKYPDNIVNNMMTGVTYLYLKRPDDAHQEFRSVLRVDSKNQRVHYWIGRAYQKQRQPDKAKTSYETYLSFDNLEPYQRAATHYRLGDLAYRSKEYVQAELHYKTAVKLHHKGAKRALDRLEQKRKDGVIDY